MYWLGDATDLESGKPPGRNHKNGNSRPSYGFGNRGALRREHKEDYSCSGNYITELRSPQETLSYKNPMSGPGLFYIPHVTFPAARLSYQ